MSVATIRGKRIKKIKVKKCVAMADYVEEK